MKDALYLLPPGFEGHGRREYCPECAELWGFLHYFPAIRDDLEIVHQPIDHPRPGLVARLGPGEWNCPTLILADASPHVAPERIRTANGVRYLDSARAIGAYYAARYGLAVPRSG
ncbi:MAG: DUF3088 family protein [Alphaproteobacteria bacterium]|nr:DUF3088 family protein [Alphaproteobacteria bacterium]